MPKKPEKKTGTASNPTVETQLKTLEAELNDVKIERDGLRKENTNLKRQLHEANTVIATDLKTNLVRRIMDKSQFTKPQLDSLEIEELQHIDSTLSMSKPGTVKNIRAAGDVTDSGKLTVGNLHGLTREQILKLDSED